MPLSVQRLALLANVPLAITPPTRCGQVTIGNAGPADLQFYVSDPAQYQTIGAGYERKLELSKPTPPVAGAWPLTGFDPNIIAFYVLSTQNGTVVLEWL